MDTLKKKRRAQLDSDSEEENIKSRPKKEIKPSNEDNEMLARKLPLNTASCSNQSLKVITTQKRETLCNAVQKSLLPSEYSVTQTSYNASKHACWQYNKKIPFLALCSTLSSIEEESSRIKITLYLTNFLRSVMLLSPGKISECVQLCLNRVGPAYEGLELGIGEMVAMKAIAQATGRTLDKIRADVHEHGDLGLVAEHSRSSQKMLLTPAPLTVESVWERFRTIASMSGNASMNKKVDIIRSMLVACQGCESRYLVRMLCGKLRIGLAEQTVLAALGHAAAHMEYDKASSEDKHSSPTKEEFDKAEYAIKSVYCQLPNYERVLTALLKHGYEELHTHCYLTPGIPLKPMLAHPSRGVSEILNRFDSKGAFTCEYKYDGERAQIHVHESGDVSIFSRNQENNTSKYPDIIKLMSSVLNADVKSIVIDSEVVAWDVEKKQILPFQILTTRKRKDVNEEDIKVHVCVYAFDLLFLNGESQVRKSFRERRALLRNSVKVNEGVFTLAVGLDSSDTDEIATFLEQSVHDNCEGLMVKTLDTDATYEIAHRSHNWLKLKKDYLEGVGDTMDLVVIGGYKGKGKRSGVWGGFLLACYDPDSENYQTICKIGTGFSDSQLESYHKLFSEHLVSRPPSYYMVDSQLTPDQWFAPFQVWEVKAADLSLSPIHKAAIGLVENEKGISLRFPRFLKIREDKNPEDATSAVQIAQMYRNQDQVKNAAASNSKQAFADSDFY